MLWNAARAPETLCEPSETLRGASNARAGLLELPANDDERLGPQRIGVRAEQRREVDVHLRERSNLQTGTDEKAGLVRPADTARILRVHHRQLGLNADRYSSVFRGVAQ